MGKSTLKISPTQNRRGISLAIVCRRLGVHSTISYKETLLCEGHHCPCRGFTSNIIPKTSAMDSDLHTSTIEISSADDIAHEVQNLGIKEEASSKITCFSDIFNDIPIHFQIISFPKQIYAWIGCHTARFGCLYAAAPTRPNNTVSVTSLLGGTSDNTGSGIARRIVLKTGVPVTLTCNIPKDSPMLEAHVEKKLIQKLIFLGYAKSKPQVVMS